LAKSLSTFTIAKLLHVDPGSVANWVDRGLLRAYRTPGGHRRIAREDLLQFLREHQMPIPPELAPAPPRVLVVDDEVAVTQMVARAIETAHPTCEVIQAHDGFAAGTVVATLQPDVVVLDLRMPGIDGYEVCRLIKSQDGTKHTVVIAITAYPSPQNEERIRRCGAAAYLTKPLDLDALLGQIGEALPSGDGLA